MANERETLMSTEKQVRKEGDRPAQKRRRVPLGRPQARLGGEQEIPGFVLHWFNDENARLHQAEQGGYAFVRPDEVNLPAALGSDGTHSDRVSRRVGTTDHGHPIYAYLMKIETDLWEEDMRAAQEPVDRIDSMIRNGVNGPSVDSRYTPKSGIKYSN